MPGWSCCIPDGMTVACSSGQIRPGARPCGWRASGRLQDPVFPLAIESVEHPERGESGYRSWRRSPPTGSRKGLAESA
jgi:hypothetical protein